MNSQVKPKKSLGQHFLRNDAISQRIAENITFHKGYKNLLEIGPGTGALTRHLLQLDPHLKVVEIDRDSVQWLKKNIPALEGNIIEEDFLQLDLNKIYNDPVGVIGNFPYNISSQILFRVLEFRDLVPEVVGMFQKEVAQRIASPPGNKDYGILSVFIQAYYTVEYLFTVDENEFIPPPKVKSGVIRLLRNDVKNLPCDEELFRRVVKAAFNQRRKQLRNSLSSFLGVNKFPEMKIFTKRPEQLGVEEFVQLTNLFDLRQAQDDGPSASSG